MFPDGYNCDLMLGEDTADNAQSTSNVTSNEDGSVLERLEHLKQTNNNLVKKVLTTTANGDTTIFNYTGCVRIKGIFGVVTTIMQNKTQNMKLAITPDSLSAYDICANKDIDTFAVGSLISITGTAANAAVSTTGVGTIGPFQASEVIATCITSGIIKVVSGAANTGAITWYVQWEPLSAGATLTAA
jgi:hypothetical protein